MFHFRGNGVPDVQQRIEKMLGKRAWLEMRMKSECGGY
jgi:hypothetical protein